MVPYERFFFASPPRTATTWFLKACQIAGLGAGNKSQVHEPPKKGQGGLNLTIIRHPYHWLVSYYNLQGGMIGVPTVDRFADLVRQSRSLEEFITKCAHDAPGAVGEMFDSYRPNTVMRLDDFPWAAIEFIKSVIRLSESQIRSIATLPHQNPGRSKGNVDKRYQSLIAESESSFCDRYEYF